jgi:hypothetical protein
VWISAAAIAVLGAAVFGIIALAAMFFWGSGFYFDESFVEDDYYVEQGSVESAVEESCDDMIEAAREISVFSPRSDGARSIAAFADTGRTIVRAVDGADPDESSKAWRDDWAELVESLDEFARELEGSGEANFRMPDSGTGLPLAERMSYGSPEGCEVPLIIVALDSEAAADAFYY